MSGPLPALPALPAAAMAEVDRLMLDDLGVGTLQLMETAGHAIAAFARERCLPDGVAGTRVLALAGSGGNGGDALVAARWLAAWGAVSTVVLTKAPEAVAGAAAHQLATVQRMGIPILTADDPLPDAGLILDGLLGFSAAGNQPPRGAVATLIEGANAHPAPVLAIDLPSGLDATTGAIGLPCIRARWTVTLVLPKTGLLVPGAEAVCGAVAVADIGVPVEILRRAGAVLDASPFAEAWFRSL
ncbi:MAG: NAD(P)H-hydrate epimerase [Thermomicrobiales bacterium]